MSFWGRLKREWSAACRFAARDENLFSERIVLFAGIVIGLIFSGLVIHYIPLSHASLREARRLGVISRTVLFSYDKGQEFTYYLLALGFTTLTALWVWACWAWRGSRREGAVLAEPAPSMAAPPTGKCSALDFVRRPISTLIAPAILVFLYWSPHYFFRSQYYYQFFSEAGQYFVALEAMLRGGALYRDVFFIYGPLSIYPVYWMMRLFGPDVRWLRVQTFSLDLLGIVLVYFFLRRFTRRRWTPFLGTLLFVILYFPDWPAPNGGLFRYFAGLIPLMFLGRYFKTKKPMTLALTGIVAGLVFFYSQEIGACSLLTVVPIAAMEAWEGERLGWRGALRRGLLVLAYGLTAIAAGIGYFFLRGAGPQFLDSLWTYPRTVALGGFGLAYPNLIVDFQNLFLIRRLLAFKIFFWELESYYPILLYLAVAVIYLIRFFEHRVTRDGWIWAGVALYGITLFRSALARSNYLKLNWCLIPALLLALSFLDDLWKGVENSPAQSVRTRRVRYCNAFLIVMLVALLGGYYGTVGRDGLTGFVFENVYKMDRVLARRSTPSYDPYNSRALDIPRARGMVAPQEWAPAIVKTVDFFKHETRPGETVLVFPAAVAYNFLVDRPAPTLIPAPYLCITRQDRREMVRQLERSRNRFIIYDTLSWRLDNLPSAVHFPELAYYIDTHYRIYRDFGDTKILKRLPTPADKIPLVDF